METEEEILFEEQPPHAVAKGDRPVSDVVTFMIIGLGGFAGANARYLIGRAALQRWGPAFPYGTLIINVAGCFVLGLFGTLAERLAWNDAWRLVIAVGFLGAFTTFSTFEYETFHLVTAGSLARAGANILLSVAVGFAAVAGGVLIARAILKCCGG